MIICQAPFYSFSECSCRSNLFLPSLQPTLSSLNFRTYAVELSNHHIW